MIIERNEYLKLLLAKRWNGKVKIVTGIRRSGKSFLLSTLFKNRLIKKGPTKMILWRIHISSGARGGGMSKGANISARYKNIMPWISG